MIASKYVPMVTQFNHAMKYGAPALARFISWQTALNTSDPVNRAKWFARYERAIALNEKVDPAYAARGKFQTEGFGK